MRIAEANNTVQYWTNLGSQQSAIVIGPVSPFAWVKCWADGGGLCRLFKLTELQLKLGPVSTNHSGSEKTRVRNSIGPFLCRKQVLAARVCARIGRQVYTGVIIPATARYWQPIFDIFLAMLGQC